MLKFIYKIFAKSKKPKAQIYFELDYSDSISIVLDYDTKLNGIGDSVGKFLYSINKGLLMTSIMDQLNNSNNNLDPYHPKLVADILESWNRCYLIDGFNEPVIKPIGAFAKNVK